MEKSFMELFVNTNGFPFIESLSEPEKGIYRITKADVERILNEAKTKGTEPPEIMCKEYGEDDCWVGIYPEDLNDDGTLDEDYKTFEMWQVDVETDLKSLPVNKHFPRGFDNWQETHFEIVAYLMDTKEIEGEPASIRFAGQGRGGLYEMAEEMTDAFEESNKDTIWDGEFFDTLSQWLTDNSHLFTLQQDASFPNLTY